MGQAAAAFSTRAALWRAKSCNCSKGKGHDDKRCCAVHVTGGGSGWRLQCCGLRQLHFPRIPTHLLRPLHVDKRGRQPFDFHKLHSRSTAKAENNAVVDLLMRHASGLRVDGDAIVVLGPSAYHRLDGGCSVHSAVHFNCSSSSSVTHALAQLPPPSLNLPHLRLHRSPRLAIRGKNIFDPLTPPRPRLLQWGGSCT